VMTRAAAAAAAAQVMTRAAAAAAAAQVMTRAAAAAQVMIKAPGDDHVGCSPQLIFDFSFFYLFPGVLCSYASHSQSWICRGIICVQTTIALSGDCCCSLFYYSL
jgi:hypothetical protein